MRRIEFLLTIGLLILLSSNARSQHVISVGLDLTAGYSTATSKIPNALTESSSKGGIVPDFGVSFNYFLNKTFGFSSGIRLISFNQTTSGKEYYTAFDATDTENQPYERRVWAKDISEKLSLHLVNIPLHFFYKYSFNRNMALFADAGPGIFIPVVRNYSASGVFTYKGYYPDTHALLYDIPVYGFSSNVVVDSKLTLKAPLAILNVGASVGFAFAMNRYYNFVASVGYIRTVTPVAKNITPHTISNEIGSFNSFLNNGGGYLSNFSVSIGITKDILF